MPRPTRSPTPKRTSTVVTRRAASRTRTVVYPNPSEGLFHVLLPDDGSVDVRILDMNGSVVRTERSSGRRSLRVDLRNTPEGMYILELRSATGVARECLVRN